MSYQSGRVETTCHYKSGEIEGEKSEAASHAWLQYELSLKLQSGLHEILGQNQNKIGS